MPNPNIGRYLLGNQTNGNIHPPSTTSSTMKRGGRRKSKSSHKRQTQSQSQKRRQEPDLYTQTGSRYYIKKRKQTRKRKTDL